MNKRRNCEETTGDDKPRTGPRIYREKESSERALTRIFCRTVGAILLAVICFVSMTRGQSETATLSGVITDEGGGAVPNCEVLLQSVERGNLITAKTDEAGLYVFPSVDPGQYSLTVRKAGFKQVDLLSLIVNVQDHIEQNFRIQVGSVSESVTVTAEGNNLNTTDATVSAVIDRNLVDNLPLNGRSLQQLVTLAPGVVLAANGGERGQFNVNGQRATANYFVVDGVSALSPVTQLAGGVVGTGGGLNAAGGTNGMVSVDALQEFRVLTSSFAPEFGRTPGGQVILRTRSGTNDFHGALFEYFRNNVLDATDWFVNAQGEPAPALRSNDFGGVLGGPIVPKKTFFFFSYEAQRLLQPGSLVTTVPSVASRQEAPPATSPILNAFPVPNGPVLTDGQAQFAAAFSNPVNTNSTSIRIDQIFNSKLSIFGRYWYAPSNTTARQDPGNVLLATPFTEQGLTVGLTYMIRPSTANEARFNAGETSYSENYTMDKFGGATPLANSFWYFPGFSPQNAQAFMLVGSSEIRTGLLAGFGQRQINAVDNLTQVLGSHELKFGVDYRNLNPHSAAFQGFLYYFLGGVPSVVSNAPNFFYNSYQGRIQGDIANFSLYGQDTWRVSSRFTFTYGLRWDVNPAPRNRDANNGNYVPLLGNYATGDVYLGAPGSSLFNTQFLNFAPRLGVAYQLRQAKGQETVIRAGAGLFFDVGETATGLNPWNNFPLSNYAFLSTPTLPIDPASAVLPPIDLANPAVGSNFQISPRNLQSPRTWQWNVALQQALGSDQTLTVTYVGALGQKLIYEQNYPSVGPNEYRVYYFDNSGSSSYNALQLQFERRLSHGLSAFAGYAWSHSIDTSSSDVPGAYVAPIVYEPASSNRGPSDFDIRHALHAGLSYNVPGVGDPRFARAVTQGWGLDLILTAQSALPITVTKTEAVGFGSFAFRPDLVPDVPLWLNNSSVAGGREINSAAFVMNQNGQGDLGRNALRGFALVQADLSARRSFSLTERLKLLFRADFFNVLNHPNFANPVSDLSSALFGQSTSMQNGQLGGGAGFGLNPLFQIGGPRSIQLSLKLQF